MVGIITTSDFWCRLGQSHWTIVGWAFVNYVLISGKLAAFQFYLLSMSKKDKDKCYFQRRVFCFYRFRLNLALRKVLYLLLFIVPKLASIMEVRQSVFRTQSNIYDGAKMVKHFVMFNPWKVPWNWTTFYWNSSFMSPGLIRDKTEGLANETCFSNPIISLKQ